MSHFGWRADDWDRLGRATMAGHLLECGAQVCGGYFADPGYKDVPGLDDVGFPDRRDRRRRPLHRSARPTAPAACVTEATVKEQLLYEVHDPAAYLTPDVVADIGEAEVQRSRAPTAWRSAGVRGHARPASYKVNVCHEGGWLAEGEISYAGPRAEARARLAADVLRQRLAGLALRVDLIGALSILGDDAGRLLARHARRRRARRAPARRRHARRPRRGRAAGARGDGALHLRPGRRRRRAHRAHAAAQHALLPAAARARCRCGFEMRGGAHDAATSRVPLYRAAHGRTGDKGNRSNISVIAWHPEL